MRRWLSASAFLLALSSGCLIVEPSCSTSGGATIIVSPSVIVVSVGESSRSHASWCSNGRYNDLAPAWSLGQPADADVIDLDRQTGQVTGRRAGTATLVATWSGAEAARVQVQVR
jgi:hypothetical protein